MAGFDNLTSLTRDNNWIFEDQTGQAWAEFRDGLSQEERTLLDQAFPDGAPNVDYPNGRPPEDLEDYYSTLEAATFGTVHRPDNWLNSYIAYQPSAVSTLAKHGMGQSRIPPAESFPVTKPQNPRTLARVYETGRDFTDYNFQLPTLQFLNDMSAVTTIGGRNFTRLELDLFAAFVQDEALARYDHPTLKTTLAFANKTLTTDELNARVKSLSGFFTKALSDTLENPFHNSAEFQTYADLASDQEPSKNPFDMVDPNAEQFVKTFLDREIPRRNYFNNRAFSPMDTEVRLATEYKTSLQEKHDEMMADNDATHLYDHVIAPYEGDQKVRTEIYKKMGVDETLVDRISSAIEHEYMRYSGPAMGPTLLIRLYKIATEPENPDLIKPADLSQADWDIAMSIATRRVQVAHDAELRNTLTIAGPIVAAVALVAAGQLELAPAALELASFGVSAGGTGIGIYAADLDRREAREKRISLQSAAVGSELEGLDLDIGESVLIANTEETYAIYGEAFNVLIPMIPGGQSVKFAILHGGAVGAAQAYTRSGFADQAHADDKARVAGTEPENVITGIVMAGVLGAVLGGGTHGLVEGTKIAIKAHVDAKAQLEISLITPDGKKIPARIVETNADGSPRIIEYKTPDGQTIRQGITTDGKTLRLIQTETPAAAGGAAEDPSEGSAGSNTKSTGTNSRSRTEGAGPRRATGPAAEPPAAEPPVAAKPLTLSDVPQAVRDLPLDGTRETAVIRLGKDSIPLEGDAADPDAIGVRAYRENPEGGIERATLDGHTHRAPGDINPSSDDWLLLIQDAKRSANQGKPQVGWIKAPGRDGGDPIYARLTVTFDPATGTLTHDYQVVSNTDSATPRPANNDDAHFDVAAARSEDGEDVAAAASTARLGTSTKRLLGDAADNLELVCNQYDQRGFRSQSLDTISELMPELTESTAPEADALRGRISDALYSLLTTRNNAEPRDLLQMVDLYTRLEPAPTEAGNAREQTLKSDKLVIGAIKNSGRPDASVVAMGYAKARYLETAGTISAGESNPYLEIIKDNFGLYSGDTFTGLASQSRFDGMVALLSDGPQPLRDIATQLLGRRMTNLSRAILAEQESGLSGVSNSQIYEGKNLRALWSDHVATMRKLIQHFQDPLSMGNEHLARFLTIGGELTAGKSHQQLIEDYIRSFTSPARQRNLGLPGTESSSTTSTFDAAVADDATGVTTGTARSTSGVKELDAAAYFIENRNKIVPIKLADGTAARGKIVDCYEDRLVIDVLNESGDTIYATPEELNAWKAESPRRSVQVTIPKQVPQAELAALQRVFVRDTPVTVTYTDGNWSQNAVIDGVNPDGTIAVTIMDGHAPIDPQNFTPEQLRDWNPGQFTEKQPSQVSKPPTTAATTTPSATTTAESSGVKRVAGGVEKTRAALARSELVASLEREFPPHQQIKIVRDGEEELVLVRVLPNGNVSISRSPRNPGDTWPPAENVSLNDLRAWRSATEPKTRTPIPTSANAEIAALQKEFPLHTNLTIVRDGKKLIVRVYVDEKTGEISISESPRNPDEDTWPPAYPVSVDDLRAWRAADNTQAGTTTDAATAAFDAAVADDAAGNTTGKARSRETDYTYLTKCSDQLEKVASGEMTTSPKYLLKSIEGQIKAGALKNTTPEVVALRGRITESLKGILQNRVNDIAGRDYLLALELYTQVQPLPNERGARDTVTMTDHDIITTLSGSDRKDAQLCVIALLRNRLLEVNANPNLGNPETYLVLIEQRLHLGDADGFATTANQTDFDLMVITLLGVDENAPAPLRNIAIQLLGARLKRACADNAAGAANNPIYEYYNLNAVIDGLSARMKTLVPDFKSPSRMDPAKVPEYLDTVIETARAANIALPVDPKKAATAFATEHHGETVTVHFDEGRGRRQIQGRVDGTLNGPDGTPLVRIVTENLDYQIVLAEPKDIDLTTAPAPHPSSKLDGNVLFEQYGGFNARVPYQNPDGTWRYDAKLTGANAGNVRLNIDGIEVNVKPEDFQRMQTEAPPAPAPKAKVTRVEIPTREARSPATTPTDQKVELREPSKPEPTSIFAVMDKYRGSGVYVEIDGAWLHGRFSGGNLRASTLQITLDGGEKTVTATIGEIETWQANHDLHFRNEPRNETEPRPVKPVWRDYGSASAAVNSPKARADAAAAAAGFPPPAPPRERPESTTPMTADSLRPGQPIAGTTLNVGDRCRIRTDEGWIEAEARGRSGESIVFKTDAGKMYMIRVAELADKIVADNAAPVATPPPLPPELAASKTVVPTPRSANTAPLTLNTSDSRFPPTISAQMATRTIRLNPDEAGAVAAGQLLQLMFRGHQTIVTIEAQNGQYYLTNNTSTPLGITARQRAPGVDVLIPGENDGENLFTIPPGQRIAVPSGFYRGISVSWDTGGSGVRIYNLVLAEPSARP